MALRRKHRPERVDEALFDAARVDLVVIASDGRSVDLVIVADAPWTGSDAQIRSLQEKIHNYVSFAVDGQMIQMYPETESLPWRINVRCLGGRPDERTSDVLDRTVEPVRRHGGDLHVHA